MHSKNDFIGQKVDFTACYLPCKEVADMAGRSRSTVFYDIQKRRLPAIWHATYRNGRKTRAYLVHPDDAKKYVEKVKSKKRVNWNT